MPIPQWFPDSIWQDEPCYIIGGGTSLEKFDWNLLQGKNVIGCNVAFYMGVDLVPFIVFGDAAFVAQQRSGLDKYAKSGGQVVTCSNSIDRFNPPKYIKLMKKQLHGLSLDGVGWNGNTGAIAINLALLFGADPIYLLGYDMQLSEDGKKNYHNCYSDKPDAKAYNRFLHGMTLVARDLSQLFPGHQVINLEDDTSILESFPKESLKAHFSKVEELVK